MKYHTKLSTLIKLEDLETSAQQQIWDNLSHDFLLQLAIMPDCHTGYCLPIGGVALLDGVISPEYVGYDIGCGMTCLITDIKASQITPREREKIFNDIYNLVPVGFTCRSKAKKYIEFKSASGDRDLNSKVNEKLGIQLGTLGSGNHFIEIGETRLGLLAITIHSGSRNPGHSIASYYMKLSKTVDTNLPGGFLDITSEHGQAYLMDMEFALKYALNNRTIMLYAIAQEIFNFSVGNDYINETHNHAIVSENNTVLHRKGATPADVGQLGVIPGNMKDGVFITIGLGNKEFLSSASHGAGRKMSRKKAKENINLNHFEKSMHDAGVLARVNQGTLDEAPDAYKNLKKVIEAQEGIVIEVVDFIKPLINIKG